MNARLTRKSQWTQFHDMHSGGSPKEKFLHAFIEAPINEAESVFFSRFGHSPRRVTCTCCGEDYSITESGSFDQATGYERGCDFGQDGYLEKPRHSGYQTPEQFLKRKDIHVIFAEDIKQDERAVSVPEQGYVWQD